MRKRNKRSELLRARVDHALFEAVVARSGPRGRSAFVETATRVYLAILDVLETERAR